MPSAHAGGMEVRARTDALFAGRTLRSIRLSAPAGVSGFHFYDVSYCLQDNGKPTARRVAATSPPCRRAACADQVIGAHALCRRTRQGWPTSCCPSASGTLPRASPAPSTNGPAPSLRAACSPSCQFLSLKSVLRDPTDVLRFLSVQARSAPLIPCARPTQGCPSASPPDPRPS